MLQYHIAATCIIALGAIILGAYAADRYHLPVFHIGGLLHGMLFFVLYPIDSVLFYWLLRPVFHRIARTPITVQPGLPKHPRLSVVLSRIGFLIAPLAVGGIITGHLTRARCKGDQRSDSGVALLGLILGYGALTFWTTFVLAMSLDLYRQGG
jgi:hypothetical protein